METRALLPAVNERRAGRRRLFQFLCKHAENILHRILESSGFFDLLVVEQHTISGMISATMFEKMLAMAC